MELSDILSLLAIIFSIAMPYIYYHKPIDFNIDNIGRDVVNKVILTEFVILFSTIMYFELQKAIKFDETKGFDIYCYSLIIFSIGCFVYTWIRIVKGKYWDKSSSILEKHWYLLVDFLAHCVLFYININWISTISGQPMKEKIIISVATIIPIGMVVMGICAMIMGNSRYKNTTVEIYYYDKVYPEYICYNKLVLKENTIQIKNDDGHREINRANIREIRYRKKMG